MGPGDGYVDAAAELNGSAPATPSLMAEAMAAIGVTHVRPRDDRQLLVDLLRAATAPDIGRPRPRWAHTMALLHHGAGVSQALCRAAGLDPDEEAGGGPPDLNLTAVCRECGVVAADEDCCCVVCGEDVVVVDGLGSAETLLSWLGAEGP